MATHAAKSSSGLIEHEVAHHFDSLEQEFDSHKLGMWLFLASEIMMFGALFVGALVFLTLYPDAFHEGSHHLSWQAGAINTFFLLTSGLTMGLAVYAAQHGEQAKVRLNLIISIVLASGFLVVKTIEYATKFEHGTLPGKFFTAHGFTDPHTHVFYGLYFVMTGLHGLHVLIGMALMIWCLIIAGKYRFTRAFFTPVELVALYWALVDLIWVFLFPLLYLIVSNTMEQQYPGHVIPKGTLFGTYFSLIFLTAIMVGLSRIDVDKLHVDWVSLHAIKALTIMGIALVMGIITSMFLMGLRYENKLLNLTIFLSNFVFLFIFVVFTWADTSFRGEIDPSFNEKINWTSPVKVDPGAKQHH